MYPVPPTEIIGSHDGQSAHAIYCTVLYCITCAVHLIEMYSVKRKLQNKCYLVSCVFEYV